MSKRETCPQCSGRKTRSLATEDIPCETCDAKGYIKTGKPEKPEKAGNDGADKPAT